MDRRLARRLLATVATSVLLTLPASAALASPPEHADRGAASERHVSEDDDGDDSADSDHQFGESQHPSGKDRTDHQDKPQGNAQSDPDDDGIGMERDGRGEDKPGIGGGEYTDDQDGNNGCGNDQDFEDDNNGLCGGPSGDVDEDDDTVTAEHDNDDNDDGGETTEIVETDEITGTGDADGDETSDSSEEVVEFDADALALPEPLAPVTDDLTHDDGTLVEVLAQSIERPNPDAAPATADAPASAAAVLSAAPAVTLPATGVSVVALGIGGLLTLGGGELLRRRTR